MYNWGHNSLTKWDEAPSRGSSWTAGRGHGLYRGDPLEAASGMIWWEGEQTESPCVGGYIWLDVGLLYII